MYNRYIPQSDGSYQRSRLPDQASPPVQRQPDRKPQPHRAQPPPPQPVCPPPPPRRERPEPPKSPAPGIGSFLKNLLPKEFDTEDLLIILMFLLMSKDSKEDQNSALLTLALYLFM